MEILGRPEEPDLLNGPTLDLLSARLRAETIAVHHEVERTLRLRINVINMAAYRGCIEHFYRIYRPLEAMLTSFVEWPRIGISLSYRLQTGNLASDLEALGSHPPRLKDLPASFLPALPTFAHSLGALYVLQGSTLGSQHILHHLTQVLGENIAGANTFFRGHGPLVPKLWTEFRASLDAYGVEHPKQTDDVIGGANATFKAINEWMQA